MKHITTPSGSLSDRTRKSDRRSARRSKVLKSAVTAVPTLIEALEQRMLLSISATGSAITPVEGSAFTGTVATFTDTTPSPATSYAAVIHWGDATQNLGVVTLNAGTFTVAGTHTYAEDGSYATSIVIVDTGNGDQAVAPGSAAVAETQIPVTLVPFSPVEGTGFTGTVATFSDPTALPADTFTPIINWGDGTANTTGSVTGSAAAGFTVGGSHTYGEEGAFSISVSVTEDGAPVTFSTSLSGAQEVPPNASTATGVGSVVLNAARTSIIADLSFSGLSAPAAAAHIHGPAPAGVNAAVLFPFAGVPAATSGTVPEQTFAITPTQVGQLEAGLFYMNVHNAVFPGGEIRGQLNPPSAASGTVTVTEAQITGLSGGGATPTINEGGITAAITGLATFTDPAGAEPNASDPAGTANTHYTTLIHWGDGTSSAGNVVNTGGNNFRVDAPAHTYGEEGTYSVTVDVTHETAATLTVAGATVTVAEVQLTNLTANPGAGGVGPEGLTTISNFTAATFTDPAGAEPNASDPAGTPNTHYTSTINWGDGTTSAGNVVNMGGNNFAVQVPAHTYGEEGIFIATVTVQHETAAPLTITAATITATEVPLTNVVGTNAVASAPEGSPAISGFVWATFTDPAGAEPNAADPAGTANTHYVTVIHWGDGTSDPGNVVQIGATNNFEVQGPAHTYGEEGVFTVTVDITHETAATLTVVGGTLTLTEVQITALTGGGLTPTSNEGSSTGVITGLATFTDSAGAEPNASDPLPATPNGHYTTLIHWGDGTTSPGNVVITGATTLRVDGPAHTYGEEGTYTVTVDVTHETAPTQTVTGAIVTVADVALTNVAGIAGATAPEGVPYNGFVATFTDPAGAEPNASDPGPIGTHYSATINWGDGTTTAGAIGNFAGTNNFHVDGSHTYADEGSFTVTTTITHEALAPQAATTPLTATEADNLTPTSPSQTFTLLEGGTLSGVSATFSDAGNPGNTAADFTGTINWGDGTTTAGTVTGGGGSFTVSGAPHTYAEEGLYTNLVITIADDAPGTSTASVTDQALVIDAPLHVTAVPFTSAEGAAATPVLVATFTDDNPNPDINDFSSNINWGDGGASSGTIVANGSGGFNVFGTHQYLEEGTFTGHVNVQDAGSGAGANITGTVTDPAVVATGGFTLAGVEGASTGSAVVATFTDPGGAEPNPADPGPIATHYSASINWGDGTPVDNTGVITFSTATQTFTVSGTHTYAEEGVFTPSIVIHHETAPNSNVVTDTATISDPAVVAVGGVQFHSVEGKTTGPIVVATFTDPGGAEPNAADPGAIATHYAATIDWGDGTPADTSGVITFNAGVFSVTGSHVYAEESAADHSGSTPYIIHVTVAHESAPVSNTVFDTMVVFDAAVVASGAPDINGSEGQSLTATVATFTDPGGPEATGDYTATIDWGDGSTSAGTITADGVVVGQFDVTGTHTYAEESTDDHTGSGDHYVVSVTIRHENAPVSNTVTTNAFIDDPAVVATGGAPVTGVESQTVGPVVVATFTDPGGAEATGDYTAAIDWGDGTPIDTSGTISYDSGTQTFSVTGAHIYDEESAPEHANSQPYNISVTISHENPPVNDSNTVTTTATIAELPVTGTALPNAASAVVGVSTGPVALAKFIDPGDAESLADYSATVNFHDGSAAAATTITYDGMTGYFTVTASHTYTTAGTFAAPTITIVHETTTTVVQDKNPVTVGSPLSGSGATINGIEGRPLTAVKVASFTASNSALASGFTATINWGDGATTAGTIVKDSNGHFHVNGTHTYQEQIPAGATLTIKITPTVGSSITVFGLAKIPDGMLLSGVGTNFTVKKGVTFNSHLLGSFTDQDAFNTLPSYIGGGTKISWGDGSTTTMTNANFKRTGANSAIGTFWQILGTHAYSSVGTKMVTLTIKDNGGAPPITITLKITVTN